MTAASAYSSEQTDGRPSEPSMEDILASIRRIIADDQGQGTKSAQGNGLRRPTGQAGDGDRGLTRARTPYDDVLDLARLVPSPDRGIPRPQDDGHRHEAEEHASVPYAASDAEEQQAEEEHTRPSTLRARLPEPASRATAPDPDQDLLSHSVGDDGEGELLSAPLGASVMSAFETLAATVVLQNTPMLERVMRDLLRPMLKTWLDDNLPALVERLVRAEIERVARGSRV